VKKFGLAKDDRIYLKNDFKNILERGKKVYANGVILWARPNPAAGGEKERPPVSRIGIIVSKKLGNAAQRNRCKRLLREAFRLNRHLLNGADCVFYPKDAAKLKDYQAARAAFGELSAKAKILRNNKDLQ
jgi:ribonuclease P protein component